MKYTVRGTHPFPFDMLRYDRSWPTGQGIENLSRRPHHDAPVVAFEVQLETDDQPGGLPRPTIGRWNSFGWAVVEIDGAPQQLGKWLRSFQEEVTSR